MADQRARRGEVLDPQHSARLQILTDRQQVTAGRARPIVPPQRKEEKKMAVRVDQFMCRSDNFGVLVHDDQSGRTLLVDAPEEAPILAAIERTGWKPDLLLITHHHGDHVEANLALKKKFGLTIIGPAGEAAK